MTEGQGKSSIPLPFLKRSYKSIAYYMRNILRARRNEKGMKVEPATSYWIIYNIYKQQKQSAKQKM